MNEYDELTFESVCSQPSAGRNGDGMNGDRDTGRDTQLEQDEMRETKLQKDEEARNVSREERKIIIILAIMQLMRAGSGMAHCEGRVGHENEKVGEKHRFRDACDTGGGEASAHWPCGEGGAGTQSGMVSRAHASGSQEESRDSSNLVRREHRQRKPYKTPLSAVRDPAAAHAPTSTNSALKEVLEEARQSKSQSSSMDSVDMCGPLSDVVSGEEAALAGLEQFYGLHGYADDLSWLVPNCICEDCMNGNEMGGPVLLKKKSALKEPKVHTPQAQQKVQTDYPQILHKPKP